MCASGLIFFINFISLMEAVSKFVIPLLIMCFKTVLFGFVFTAYKTLPEKLFLKNSIDVFMVISVFLIMGIDMVRLIFLRLLNKKNPFDRDLNHFHHILLKRFNIELTIFIYLTLSFMPVILSSITKITAVIYIPLPIIIYIILIYRFK